MTPGSSTRTYVISGVLIAVLAAALTSLIWRFGFEPARAAQTVVPGSTERNTVTVLGEGKARAAPDMATVDLGVQVNRRTVRQGLDAANAGIQKVIAAAKASGVDSADLQSTPLTVTNVSGSTGSSGSFAVRSRVHVTIRDLTKMGAIIAAAADAVGGDELFESFTVSFGHNDTDSSVKTAREAAMASANAKAKEWARLSGRQLGKVLAVSEASSPAQPSRLIESGPGDISVVMTVVYALD